MTIEELQAELAEATAQQQAWQQRIAESNDTIRQAQQQGAAAQRQADCWAGHVERLQIWIERIGGKD